jgi:glycosyltransferase involved in cell wall biosynthesis
MGKGATQRPKYSVLLPTHNRAEVLPFAIRSVLCQTIEDFELLVVGDGCTDETAEVVRGFNDRRIRWFDLPKAPHFGYANRNVALREATGQLIAFMAHDDLWLPDHLELLARCLEQSEAEIVYSRPVWIIPPGLIAPLVFNLHHPETLSRFVEKKSSSIPAGCFVHKRECLDKYGYWNADLPSCGDLDMWARIIEGGGRENFAYLPEATCLHFRANWRKETDVGQPVLYVWKALHAVDNFMPDALKVNVPPGLTEQEACWLAIEANPRRWTTSFRAAVHSVIEKRLSLSDEMILGVLSAEGSNQTDAYKLFESYAQIEKLARLADEIAEDAIGRKLIRRTRRLLAVLAPPDTMRGRSLLGVKKALRRTL